MLCALRAATLLRAAARRCQCSATPAAASASALPFRLFRSRMGNLPFYKDTRNGGTRRVTVVRKYAGDVDALATELEEVCASRVQRFHGRLEVKGFHVETLTAWAAKHGF